MEEIPSSVAQYGWGGAAALLVLLLLAVFLRRSSREDAAVRERRALEAELVRAQADWAAANHAGDAPRMHAARGRINRLRGLLGKGAALVGVLLLSSCRSPAPPPPAVRTVALSEHCRTIAPGETVPPLPEGEGVYWLCTPTGLEMLLPADSILPSAP